MFKGTLPLATDMVNSRGVFLLKEGLIITLTTYIDAQT